MYFKRKCSFSVVKVASLLRVGRKIKRKTTNCATSNLAGDLNVRSLDTRSAFTSSIIHISWCNTTLPVARCTNGWVTQMNIHGVSCKVLKGVCAQNSNAIHFFYSQCADGGSADVSKSTQGSHFEWIYVLTSELVRTSVKTAASLKSGGCNVFVSNI